MANTKRNFSSFNSCLLLLFTISLNLLVASAMLSGKPTSKTVVPSSLRIVYTIQKPINEKPEAFYIRILTSVLDSEEAAKKALVYCFTSATTGFAANLTPDQVKKILAQPGVLHVVQSVNYDLQTRRQKNINV